MKRVYLTHLVKKNLPEPLGETYVPYVPISLDGRWWSIITDTKGDDDGTGVFEKCFIGIDATEEEHAIIEADESILRIDNL